MGAQLTIFTFMYIQDIFVFL